MSVMARSRTLTAVSDLRSVRVTRSVMRETASLRPLIASRVFSSMASTRSRTSFDMARERVRLDSSARSMRQVVSPTARSALVSNSSKREAASVMRAMPASMRRSAEDIFSSTWSTRPVMPVVFARTALLTTASTERATSSTLLETALTFSSNRSRSCFWSSSATARRSCTVSGEAVERGFERLETFERGRAAAFGFERVDAAAQGGLGRFDFAQGAGDALERHELRLARRVDLAHEAEDRLVDTRDGARGARGGGFEALGQLVDLLRHAAKVVSRPVARGRGSDRSISRNGRDIALKQQGIQVLAEGHALTLGAFAGDRSRLRVNSLYAPGSLGHPSSESGRERLTQARTTGQLGVIRLTAR